MMSRSWWQMVIAISPEKQWRTKIQKMGSQDKDDLKTMITCVVIVKSNGIPGIGVGNSMARHQVVHGHQERNKQGLEDMQMLLQFKKQQHFHKNLVDSTKKTLKDWRLSSIAWKNPRVLVPWCLQDEDSGRMIGLAKERTASTTLTYHPDRTLTGAAVYLML